MSAPTGRSGWQHDCLAVLSLFSAAHDVSPWKRWSWWQYRWIQARPVGDGLATQDPGPVRITHNGAHLAPSTLFPFSRVGADREPLLKIIYMRSTTRLVVCSSPYSIHPWPSHSLPQLSQKGAVWRNRLAPITSLLPVVIHHSSRPSPSLELSNAFGYVQD